MTESQYTKPEHNILFALAKGVYELPSNYINILNDPHYSNHSKYAKWGITLLKTFIKNLHYKQLQFFSPNKSIKSQLLSTKFKHGIGLNNYGKELKEFPGAVWLVEKQNRTETDPVIIFYHGGAYLFQFRSDTHLKFLINLAKSLPAYSILLVDYPLSPHPAPQNYNLELWEHFFVEKGLQNVTTMGDSAGGHLILSSLAAIQSKKQRPKLPKLFKHVLISPWISLSLAIPTTLVENYDILDPSVSYGWGHIFTQNEIPIDISNADYGDLLDGKTLITVGELEMLHEAVEKFGEKYKLPVLVEEQGVHDQITMEKFLGYDEGDIFNSIVEFLLE